MRCYSIFQIHVLTDVHMYAYHYLTCIFNITLNLAISLSKHVDSDLCYSPFFSVTFSLLNDALNLRYKNQVINHFIKKVKDQSFTKVIQQWEMY